jgi:predicted HTH domain antitoxin
MCIRRIKKSEPRADRRSPRDFLRTVGVGDKEKDGDGYMGKEEDGGGEKLLARIHTTPHRQQSNTMSPPAINESDKVDAAAVGAGTNHFEEKIELRLKPQQTTFEISDAEVRGYSNNNDVPERRNTTDTDETKRQKTEKIEKTEPEPEPETEIEKAEIGKTDEKRNKNIATIASVNVHEFLSGIDSLTSIYEVTGTQAMALLHVLLEDAIWLSEQLEKGTVTRSDLTEVVFGEGLWNGLLEKRDHDEDATITRARLLKPILDEIRTDKQIEAERKRLVLISKSQEELGVSLRTSSKIFSNFETEDASMTSLMESDLSTYVYDKVGTYEKCCIDAERYQWLANKFYLKSEPNMAVEKYLDRINSNLDVSGAVGLCAGWFLFKFLFNIKCEEKLSLGDNILEKDLNGEVSWATRSLPLALGGSFCIADDASGSDYGNTTTGLTTSTSMNANADDSISSAISELDGEDEDETDQVSTTPISHDETTPKEVDLMKVSKLNAFRLILTCVRISSKLIEDKNFKQNYYCKVTGLQKLEDLFRLELAMGYGLDWGLFTNEYTLWRYLFHMQALTRGCQRLRERVANV